MKMIGAQGEVNVFKIEVPLMIEDGKPAEKTASDAWIVSHSESGNHHVLDADGVIVMEKTHNVPAGMKILYAVVENPNGVDLRQDADVPHETIHLDPGVYEMRIAREYDFLAGVARQVAD
jgi:hypothetical protein